MAKMTDELPKEVYVKAFSPINFIRADFITIEAPGYLGYKYILLFVDIESNYYWVYFIREKRDVYN